MKNLTYILCFLLAAILHAQQTSEGYFISSAQAYLNDDKTTALETVQEGIERFPEDEKLKRLKQKIEEENNQQNQGNNQEQDSEGQSDESSEEQENNNESGEQDGRNQGEKGSGSSDEKPQQNEGNENLNAPPAPDLTEARYNNLLNALQQQENNTRKRLMMGKSRGMYNHKEKDW